MNEDGGWSKIPFVVDAWMLVVGEEESGPRMGRFIFAPMAVKKRQDAGTP